MKRTTLFLFLSLTWAPTQIIAQDISIEGKAPDKNGAIVRAIAYSDQFSLLDTTLAYSFVDEKSEFKLSFPSPYVNYGFLAIGTMRGELYYVPGAKYRIKVNNDSLVTQGSVFDELPLSMDITITDDDDLLAEIGRFNQAYNIFMYENAQSIYRGRDRNKISSFVTKMESEFSHSQLYLSDYVHYAMINLMWLSKIDSERQILKNEFVEKPVLYHNISYTDFFRTFFDNYLDQKISRSYNEIMATVNQGSSVIHLLDFILEDTVFKRGNPVTELVAIKLLSQVYYMPDFEKQQVIKMLKELSAGSKYTENRIVAKNFIRKLTALEYGADIPEIEAVGMDGKALDMSDLKGNFVLLSFLKADCPVCSDNNTKIDTMARFLSQPIVRINLTPEDDKINSAPLGLQKGSAYTYYYDPNSLLPEKFQIRTYPAYVLINPDGKIAKTNVPMPDENMAQMIERFIGRYKK